MHQKHCCLQSIEHKPSAFLLQIQDFSSGFFSGTKLACWMKGESPWGFFPKISIYLRATNTSQSFRLTILPQVRVVLACYKNSLYDNPYHFCCSISLQLYIFRRDSINLQITPRQDSGYGLGKLLRPFKNYLLR